MNNILIILLLSYPASSYGQNLLSDTKTIKTAKMLEKKGDVEAAISIYEDILTRKPNHRQSIKNLKNIYLKYLMYDKGIEFNLFIDGRWTSIVVDNHLPLRNKKKGGSSSSH